MENLANIPCRFEVVEAAQTGEYFAGASVVHHQDKRQMTRHTYDYGLIGNCAISALIGRDTNVEWMCLPRFDSSFVFGRLVGGDKGGEFSLKPVEENFGSKQEYLPNTNILVTEIEQGDNVYRITDFAPRFSQYGRYFRPKMLLRKIEPVRGFPRIRAVCRPVGKYGEERLAHASGSSHIRYMGLDESLRLTTNIPLEYVINESEFTLRETCYMILSYGVPLEGSLENTTDKFLNRTTSYWRNWVKSTSIGEHYQAEVIRSALALKICQYEDTGAIVAAPTTSLPEGPGQGRNWDYRYSWMRDTYYILNSFNNIGHFEEMEKYFSYLTNIPMPDEKRIQPLYGLGGEWALTERELDLPGYLGNRPVRVGNDAYTHIQNDVYGQILLAIKPLYVDHRFHGYPGADTDRLLQSILDKIEYTIDEPDAGIWEFRNSAYLHTYTSLFQWAGSHAAAQIAMKLGNEALAEKARFLHRRAAMHIESSFIPELKAYGRSVKNHHMDASTLQLIIMGYLPHNSDIARSHLAALEDALKAGKGLFFRYLEEDDFGKPHSTFIICGFWYAEALACVGRLDDAMEAFEELTGYANHLGLLSEDLGKDGSMWGNFPQAYSHVGLINAAARINERMDSPGFLMK